VSRGGGGALGATALALGEDEEGNGDTGTVRVRDLRMPALGLAAWAGGLAGLLAPLLLLAAPLLVVPLLIGRGARAGRDLRRAALAWLLAALAVGTGAVLRGDALATGPVAEAAERRAALGVHLTVTSDPRPVRSPHRTTYLVRGTVRSLTGPDGTTDVHAPVLVLGDEAWSEVALGSTVATTLRLGPAEGDDVAAFASARGSPEAVAPPSVLWRGSAAVRASIRTAAAGGPYPARELVPALVDGDDLGLPEETRTDFETSGLTHLLAVSGTNLTLVVGFLLVLGRWCGVRGRGMYVLGAAGIVGFVLLARTEPSVVRAAAMGTVALIGLGANGRDRGVRALGVAVLCLLLWDPWLATTVGFTLSVLATAGILLLAPVWVRAMRTWLPRWVAEAVAVPTAAQLACTPVVAAISGQVSLVAVAANLVAAPLVGPATVLGLLGGVVGLVVAPLGAVLGLVAAWCAAGIVAVARHAAGTSLPAVPWDTHAAGLALLTALCVLLATGLGHLLARRATGVACCLLLAVVVLVPVPTPGWPPRGWVLVACDVGQGDGPVLRAGEDSAVVVDAGPDPRPVDRCLDRLGIERVPLVVLTHFHADHVDGLGGVLDGRAVGEVAVTALRDPLPGAEAVSADAGRLERVAGYGEVRTVGDVRLQVVGPLPVATGDGVRDGEGSAANNASVVVLAEVRGVRILLTGDVEPEGQEQLARSLPGLTVDVLKVPHHGSRHQDHAFLASLDAEVAIASVGADNTYGHPAPETLDPLAEAGADVRRTDTDGDVAVVVEDGRIAVRTSR
jgi:competence protein ComEC